MTHAESQDLLLDLAYGELPPERAAELETHVAGCDECQREKAALEEARRLVAPVRQLEEPGPGFDDPILAAAHAEARLEHGSVGKVIEVQGSVRPLSMEPAQIDAHQAVVRETRQRPRWAMRAALGGSVAAAAALALVVSTSLRSKQEAQQAALQRAIAEKPYEIRVAPAPAATADAARDARKAEATQAQSDDEKAPAKLATVPHAESKKAAPAQGIAGGLASHSRSAAPAAAAPPPSVAPESPRPVAVASKSEPLAAVARMKEAATPAKKDLDSTAPKNGPAAAGSVAAKATTDDAAALERQAEQARIDGSYADAAALYRRAAAARGANGSAAAWDLAHAVECLATAGRFDEARQVRAELLQLHPSETTASSAANRALRSVEAAPPAR